MPAVVTTREGTITIFSPTDGVGRIRLADGEEVRFGHSACGGFVPAVGLAVRVDGLDAHPLGGRRARSVGLADPTSADDVNDRARALPGLDGSPASLAQFVETTDRVGLLGVLLAAPLAGRAAVRALLAGAGASVDFDAPRGPLVKAEGLTLRAHVVNGELPLGARAVISFSLPTAFSLETERRQHLFTASPMRAVEAFAPLVRLVYALTRGEKGVIAHQSPGFVAASDGWRARVEAHPMWGFARTVRTPQGDTIVSGMRGLLLPDVFVRGLSNEEGTQIASSAALGLTTLGRIPAIGDRLGGAIVASADEQWVRVEPAG